MDEETVSLQTVREHYGIWRWKIERESSNKIVKIWAEIAASSIDNGTKTELANVAWALVFCKNVSFSLRAFDAGEDLVRLLGPGERDRVVVPAVDERADGGCEVFD